MEWREQMPDIIYQIDMHWIEVVQLQMANVILNILN